MFQAAQGLKNPTPLNPLLVNRKLLAETPQVFSELRQSRGPVFPDSLKRIHVHHPAYNRLAFSGNLKHMLLRVNENGLSQAPSANPICAQELELVEKNGLA
jgi:hypothetical protein